MEMLWVSESGFPTHWLLHTLPWASMESQLDFDIGFHVILPLIGVSYLQDILEGISGEVSVLWNIGYGASWVAKEGKLQNSTSELICNV